MSDSRPPAPDADIEQDQREVDRAVDKKLKFQTRSLVCAPLRGRHGDVHEPARLLAPHPFRPLREDDGAFEPAGVAGAAPELVAQALGTTGRLDRVPTEDVLRAIQARGKTIVYTTHYLDEAEILCDRVAIMDTGRILALDRPAVLVRGLDAPTHVTLQKGAMSVVDASALDGVEEAHEDEVSLTISTRRPGPVLSALADRNALDGLQVRTATLEDVFLNLTGREYRA